MFCHLNSQQLRRVIELVEIKKCQNGEVIYEKGPCEKEYAYLVLFGEVYLYNGNLEQKPSMNELDLASRATVPLIKRYQLAS